MDALNGPQMKQAAQTIASLQQKAQAGTLTAEDRKQLYSTLPMMGLWNSPARPPPAGEDHDAMERTLVPAYPISSRESAAARTICSRALTPAPMDTASARCVIRMYELNGMFAGRGMRRCL